jgi:uncharacterized Zn-finger protein
MLDVLERDAGLGVWENEGGPAAFVDRVPLSPVVPPPGPRRAVPSFLNDAGSRVVEIGVRAFNCIGATPPDDHPHVYLDMGASPSILCPYCATRFQFDAALPDGAAFPARCASDGGRASFLSLENSMNPMPPARHLADSPHPPERYGLHSTGEVS